ncbi:uncharacterized protein MELLADRAFT_85867 [Melampsora larici-populina 98AG31]|uniref:Uncharacterized protein n=1 Tax=Melampsora larici-populina (strain 98AG31 / pathotype 3-4-7) TaxID=747676 RepID=F4SDF6_MELLP|nr:uncharacterized protein MELLADRAFT_85867 [Melampsora larici-populina 98AG31]EGF97322.1 hypothetical protein MELLADRAFT_85867 [Melampsora larici-populina 98AG31]
MVFRILDCFKFNNLSSGPCSCVKHQLCGKECVPSRVLKDLLDFLAGIRSASQITLQNLKPRISSQSKEKFLWVKDIRYLDSRIALLIQNTSGLMYSLLTS